MKKLFLLSCLYIFVGNFLFGQCNADRHSAKITDQWMSCERQINPNSIRGNTHWILYDFGDTYALNNSTIWNCNIYGQTNSGIESYVVDTSNDGVNWNQFGQFNLTQAEASTFYEGEAGPDFNGLAARYILITSLNEYGGDCACLSEIRFETSGTTVNVLDIVELDVAFTLAPNPASDLVQLSIDNDKPSFDAAISLLDQTGRLIREFEASIPKGNTKLEISTIDLQSGNYLVKIQSQAGVSTRKLIVIQDHK